MVANQVRMLSTQHACKALKHSTAPSVDITTTHGKSMQAVYADTYLRVGVSLSVPSRQSNDGNDIKHPSKRTLLILRWLLAPPALDLNCWTHAGINTNAEANHTARMQCKLRTVWDVDSMQQGKQMQDMYADMRGRRNPGRPTPQSNRLSLQTKHPGGP